MWEVLLNETGTSGMWEAPQVPNPKTQGCSVGHSAPEVPPTFNSALSSLQVGCFGTYKGRSTRNEESGRR